VLEVEEPVERVLFPRPVPSLVPATARGRIIDGLTFAMISEEEDSVSSSSTISEGVRGLTSDWEGIVFRVGTERRDRERGLRAFQKGSLVLREFGDFRSLPSSSGPKTPTAGSFMVVGVATLLATEEVRDNADLLEVEENWWLMGREDERREGVGDPLGVMTLGWR
jgi:hypothetical protein